MCCDNVFNTVVWNVIKINIKFQKLQIISLIYSNEKSVNFQKL